jgi:hypothetical protein
MSHWTQIPNLKAWSLCEQETVPEFAEDLYTPSAPGSLMRSRMFNSSGMFRIARRHASLYSVEIKAAGSWGRILIYDGDGKLVFYQPSTFTGSFVLEGGCRNGIIVHINSGAGSDGLFMVNWREKDRALI